MEYKKENGTLILGSVEEMRMFANGHITINHDNVKHLVYNGTPLPLGYRCALEFIMLDLNNLKDITIKNDQNFKSVNGIIYRTYSTHEVMRQFSVYRYFFCILQCLISYNPQ